MCKQLYSQHYYIVKVERICRLKPCLIVGVDSLCGRKLIIVTAVLSLCRKLIGSYQLILERDIKFCTAFGVTALSEILCSFITVLITLS